MWVFVYGSLMWGDWATRFQGINRGIAKLKGYHRAFNKKSTSNWGTRDAPCPTLGLEESSNEECVGLVFDLMKIRGILWKPNSRKGKDLVSNLAN